MAGQQRAPRVVIYTRVSQDRDGTSMSPDVQYEACLALAQEKGLEVVEPATRFNDRNQSASSRRRKRPYFDRIVEMIRDGAIDGVVVVDFSRLLRTFDDYIRLHRDVGRQIVVYTVRDGINDLEQPGEDLIAVIRVALARSEVVVKAIRQSAIYEEMAKQGLYRGGRRPFGYQLVIKSTGEVYDPTNPDHKRAPKKLAVREDEARAIRDAVRDLKAGNSFASTVRAADRYLKSQGRETTLSPVTFKKVLLSARIKGMTTHQSQNNRELVAARKRDGTEWWQEEAVSIEYEATWEAIIDEQTSQWLRDRLGFDNRRVGGRPPRSLLSGILICGHPACIGSPLAGSGKQYTCKTIVGGCGQLAVSAPAIETYLERILLERIRATSPGTLWADPVQIAPTEEVEDLEAKKSKLAEMRRTCTRNFLDGLITEDEHQDALQVIRSRLSALEFRPISDSASRARHRGLVTTEERWNGATASEKNLTFKAVFRPVVILPAAKGGRSGPRFDESRVQWQFKTRTDYEAELASMDRAEQAPAHLRHDWSKYADRVREKRAAERLERAAGSDGE